MIEGGTINADTMGTGNAGTIKVDAGSVQLLHFGAILANSRTAGIADGGKPGIIEVTAAESILLDHEDGPPFSLIGATQGRGLTGIFSATGGGDRGLIKLHAPDITVTNGAIVATSTVSGGAGGDVVLSGDRIHILNGSFVDSTSLPSPNFPGDPGGDAGSVTLDANELIEVVGRRDVIAGGIAYEEWSHVSSASLGSGKAGEVRLTAPIVRVDGGAVATTAVPSALLEGSAGGSVTIVAGELLVTNGGRIDASTFIAGPGGNIDVTATDSIVIAGTESGIASRTGASRKGGDLTLRAPRIEVKNGGQVSAESADGLREVREIFRSLYNELLMREPSGAATGDAGSITLEATKLVHLDDGDITTSSPHGEASAETSRSTPSSCCWRTAAASVATADEGHGGHIEITTDTSSRSRAAWSVRIRATPRSRARSRSTAPT